MYFYRVLISRFLRCVRYKNFLSYLIDLVRLLIVSLCLTTNLSNAIHNLTSSRNHEMHTFYICLKLFFVCVIIISHFFLQFEFVLYNRACLRVYVVVYTLFLFHFFYILVSCYEQGYKVKCINHRLQETKCSDKILAR